MNENVLLNNQSLNLIDCKLNIESEFNLIDKIFENYGYKYYMWIPILLFFIFTAYEGIAMTSITYLIIPITEFYKLSDFQVQLISSVIFIGQGIGAFISGNFSSKYSRTLVLKTVSLSLCILYFITGLFDNFFIFFILRFLIGIVNGIQLPIAQNLITEYLPIRYRAVVLSTCWVGYTIGSLTLPVSMLFIMPNLESNKIGDYFKISSFIQFLMFIYVIKYCEDSPRNLILNGKDEEAFIILLKFIPNDLDDNIKENIIKEVKFGLNNEMTNVKQIFEEQFYKTTNLLRILFAICSISLYGPFLVSSLTIKKLGQEVEYSNNQVIIEQIILNIPMIFMSILPGIMADMQTLGRKFTIMIGFSCGALTYILACRYTNYFSFYMGISIGFLNIPFVILCIYSSEFYPTKVRDAAVGYMYVFIRIGGLISQFLYINLFNIHFLFPYYFTSLLLIFGIIFVGMLPYETYGKPLDFDHSIIKKINSYII